MARWKITVSGKRIGKEQVQKIADACAEKWGDKVALYVEDATPPESRSDRFGEAQGQISEAKSVFEELRDELQDIIDNAPENLQNSEKHQQREECVSALEEVIDQCDQIESASIDFPGMY